MAYDTATTHTILFGGLSAFDSGTRRSYDLGDTWEWTGERWIQHHLGTAPSARAMHVLVNDTTRSRILLFGGKSDKTFLNDTWIFEKSEWRRVETPNAPSGRALAGAAFDPIGDRVVLFGGQTVSADGKTLTKHYDTWEFDGTTWREVSANGPQVQKPLLTYDAARDRITMLGINDKIETLMYVYDRNARSWSEVKPSKLPPCVNEGVLTYEPHNQKLFVLEGACATSSVVGEVYEYDGDTWAKVETKTGGPRLAGAAITYDIARQRPLVFGGAAFGEPSGTMWAFAEGDWTFPRDESTPAPRSLFAFRADPINRVIWMLGGINDVSASLDDFWRYFDGKWQRVEVTGGPTSCGSPLSVYDSARSLTVFVCTDMTTYEWNGVEWKKFSDPQKQPPGRRFASLAYDPIMKKTVLFGGYDDFNYMDDTWTWDGTSWTQVKKNRPFRRALTSMWFDPALKKVVLFGGIGRRTAEGRLERFADMWSFDGSGWTDMKISTTATPGERYGAQVVVNPRTNRVLLFGGLRVETTGVTQNQVYAGDFWEWDGAAWKKLTPPSLPPARENGAFEVDPLTGELVLYAGYSGYFLSDVWTYDGQSWRVRRDEPAGLPSRRRASGRSVPTTPSVTTPISENF